MSHPYLKIAQDFVSQSEAHLGEITNWSIVGSAGSSQQARDIDLIIIFKNSFDRQKWSDIRKAWNRVTDPPKIDAAALCLADLSKDHSVLSIEWFLLYQLFHQARWQCPNTPKISAPIKGGYYWALARRWREKARDDQSLINFLANPLDYVEFPSKTLFLKAATKSSPLSPGPGIRLALKNELGLVLTNHEREEWLQFLSKEEL